MDPEAPDQHPQDLLDQLNRLMERHHTAGTAGVPAHNVPTLTETAQPVVIADEVPVLIETVDLEREAPAAPAAEPLSAEQAALCLDLQHRLERELSDALQRNHALPAAVDPALLRALAQVLGALPTIVQQAVASAGRSGKQPS